MRSISVTGLILAILIIWFFLENRKHFSAVPKNQVIPSSFAQPDSANIVPKKPREPKLTLKIYHRRSVDLPPIQVTTMQHGDTIKFFKRRLSPMFRIYDADLHDADWYFVDLQIEGYKNGRLLKSGPAQLLRVEGAFMSAADSFVEEREDFVKLTFGLRDARAKSQAKVADWVVYLDLSRDAPANF